jgi:hypothetical protein
MKLVYDAGEVNAEVFVGALEVCLSSLPIPGPT